MVAVLNVFQKIGAQIFYYLINGRSYYCSLTLSLLIKYGESLMIGAGEISASHTIFSVTRRGHLRVHMQPREQKRKKPIGMAFSKKGSDCELHAFSLGTHSYEMWFSDHILIVTVIAFVGGTRAAFFFFLARL